MQGRRNQIIFGQHWINSGFFKILLDIYWPKFTLQWTFLSLENTPLSNNEVHICASTA